MIRPNPLERAVDRRIATDRESPMGAAAWEARALAFEIVGENDPDERAALHRMATRAAQITERCRDALAADRRAKGGMS